MSFKSVTTQKITVVNLLIKLRTSIAKQKGSVVVFILIRQTYTTTISSSTGIFPPYLVYDFETVCCERRVEADKEYAGNKILGIARSEIVLYCVAR